MTDKPKALNLALAQLNPTVGDIEGNRDLLIRARAQAAALGADILVASELVLSGYQPEDLVLKPAFLADVAKALEELAGLTADGGPAMILGAPWREDGLNYNAAFLLADGVIQAKRFKHELPNYGVFDEKRVFAQGPLPGPVTYQGVRLGLMVCEDMWLPDVSECLAETGAEFLLVINGSPFERGKADQRLNPAVARVVETGLALIYVNQVGGQDELIYDGASFALQPDGALAAQLPAFVETVAMVRLAVQDGVWRITSGPMAGLGDDLEQIYQSHGLGFARLRHQEPVPRRDLGPVGRH